MSKIKAFFSRFKSDSKPGKKGDNLMVIAFLLLGILSGFIVSYLTKFYVFLPLFLFSFLLMGSLFGSDYQNKKKKQMMMEERNQYFLFYQKLITYSYLENDFQAGFKKAIDDLPICNLKDDLLDYLESENKEELPLNLLRTREETKLLDLTKKELFTEDEELKLTLENMREILNIYQSQLFPTKTSTPSSSAIMIFGLIFLITLAISIIKYVP